LRIIKKRALDDLSKKIDKVEDHSKEVEEINLNKEEHAKLQRFDLYHMIRTEKYIRQGGDPTFGNLDPVEKTMEEFEYHLSHCLNVPVGERYKRSKEMYYFHPSYMEMEKLDYWKDRAKAKYCTGQQCIPECPYYKENGRIEDEQVVKEFIDSIVILEIEDHKKELGEDLVNSMINEWNFSGM
jgi:hypothetical protein